MPEKWGLSRALPWVGIGMLFLAVWWSPHSGRVEEHKLPLVFLKQERELSCEASALRMALRFQGVDLSESELVARMPFDRTPRTRHSPAALDVWGDPDQGFVGDMDGKMGETGYGIHWNGVAALARR
jgi:hypothetical protein